MNKVLIALVLSVTGLSAVTIGPWQNLRFSGKTASNQAFLRTELPYANITVNKLIYNNGTAMTENNLSLYNADASTYQSAFPVTTERRYLGLRLQAGTSNENIVPVFYQGTGLPALNQLTTVSNDPQGETTYQNLDIVKDFFSFDDTKFYAAIQNRNGEFPTSAGLGTSYYAYMCAIAPPGADPNDPNVVVWVFNYMNVALGGISPGLYKIVGTGTSDLIRIGNIETQIVSGSNLLIMSCNISDLLADADFAAWYNVAEPSFGFASLTSRTTVIPFETVTHDQTAGGKIHPRKLFFDPTPNQPPVLTNPTFYADNDNVWFGVTYTDAQSNFPISAYLDLGGMQFFQLYPQSLDYSAEVIYKTDNIIGSISEYDNQAATFAASDNNIDYGYANLNFTYIRGLLSPAEVQCTAGLTNLNLSWSPVTQTAEGNPVTVSFYRIEFSTDPYFGTFATLGTTTNTSYSLPLAQLDSFKFYRIIAVK
ncbi:MAG: hypothetical protein R6V77_01755 [Candidatus Cloacimonadaceae bacterium]